MVKADVFSLTVCLVVVMMFGYWLGLNQAILNVKVYGVDKACEMIFEPIVLCEK